MAAWLETAPMELLFYDLAKDLENKCLDLLGRHSELAYLLILTAIVTVLWHDIWKLTYLWWMGDETQLKSIQEGYLKFWL